mmetsp:Transcript_24442/g.72681  ORF Transcript_24442/g.72681 Transcript_24442/m.72681 type:complete len:561 (+) Transcript_24442:341-2023(+)
MDKAVRGAALPERCDVHQKAVARPVVHVHRAVHQRLQHGRHVVAVLLGAPPLVLPVVLVVVLQSLHQVPVYSVPLVVVLALALERQVALVHLKEGVAGDRGALLQGLERRSEETVVVLLQDAESPAELDQLLGLERGGLALQAAENLVSDGLAEPLVLHVALREGPEDADHVHGAQILGLAGEEEARSVEEVGVREPHLGEDRQQRGELHRREAGVPRQRRAADRREELVLGVPHGHKGRQAAVQLVGRKGHEPRRHLLRRGVEEGLRELREARLALPLGVPRPGGQRAGHLRELRRRELLQSGHQHADELREEVRERAALKPRGPVDLRHQLRELLGVEGRELDEQLPGDVVDVLPRARRQHAVHERLELVVRSRPGVVLLAQHVHPHLHVHPRAGHRHGVELHGFLGLLRVALKPLQHVLDRVVVLLRLRGLRRPEEALEGDGAPGGLPRRADRGRGRHGGGGRHVRHAWGHGGEAGHGRELLHPALLRRRRRRGLDRLAPRGALGEACEGLLVEGRPGELLLLGARLALLAALLAPLLPRVLRPPARVVVVQVLLHL